MDFRRYIKEKRILVVGIGKSGTSAARVLSEQGAEVTVQDNKTIDEIGQENIDYFNKRNIAVIAGERPSDVADFDMLILSPGVPIELDFIVEAKKAGVEVIGELELAYRLSRAEFTAITGTNGKTTTTTLVGEIFKNAGRHTLVLGNIGKPVIDEVLNADEDTDLVVEVSSFQLETVESFKPHVSAILNLTPDHMDRHKTMEAYGKAKEKINIKQDESDFVVVNLDDPQVMNLIDNTEAKIIGFSHEKEPEVGAFVKKGRIFVKSLNGRKNSICDVDELKIPGEHNLENALAAAAVCYFSGIKPKVIAEILRTFKGVEHRLESCGRIDGIRFVNDSKGTNPNAAIKALNAVEKPIILIAGGYDKNSDFDEFIEAFGDKVTDLILLGATASKIKVAAEAKGFKNSIILSDMEDCVNEAFERAEEGHTILLSPACASWDMYDSYEQRGEDFKNAVRKLAVRAVSK